MTFVFDYDGTIHDSMRIYAPAFRKCCEIMRLDGEDVREYSNREIEKWIGMDVNAMWSDFRPDISEDKKKKYSGFIGEYMEELIYSGRAVLYDGALEAVRQTGVYGKTVFLSSCKRSYMEAHKKGFDLEKYFDSFYCTEDYGFKPKYAVFENIKGRYDGPFVIIGDRYSDMETAFKNGARSIGCLYGYGGEKELEMADIKVRTVGEMRQAILSEAKRDI